MRRFLPVLVCVFTLCAAAPVFAEEIGLIFTGRTHAMIYPCSCPTDPAGGVSRRASAIKAFAKRKLPYILVDSGDSFAGGLMDQYAQGAELDKERTAVNLKAMEAMGYDCAAIAESELEFGWDFFRKSIAASRVPFVCSNIRADGIVPFVVKRVGDLRVGIAAVVPELVQKKIPGSVFTPPAQALKDTIGQLQAQGCVLVVVLSDLPENESRKLIQDVPGVGIMILNKFDNEAPGNEKETFIFKSYWQGRQLGEAELALSAGGVAGLKFSAVLLSSQIPDDKEIGKLLPACFSDSNCRMAGNTGSCVSPGSSGARCSFVPAPKVHLLVIEAKDCVTCNVESVLKGLSSGLPGLSVSRASYPGAEAERYMKALNIRVLPAFLFGRDIEKVKAFATMKANLEPAGEYYRLRSSVANPGYFALRPAVKDSIDVFVSLYAQGSATLLESLKEFTPSVHFLAVGDEGQFKVPHGRNELEEDLRSVCVKKYYPGFFYNYLICRSADSESSWWDKCLEGVDAAPVRNCALGDEGGKLLDENIALNRELAITDGPAFLYGNRESFTTVNAPSKEELRKILIRK
jgi:hypothetical protein